MLALWCSRIGCDNALEDRVHTHMARRAGSTFGNTPCSRINFNGTVTGVAWCLNGLGKACQYRTSVWTSVRTFLFEVLPRRLRTPRYLHNYGSVLNVHSHSCLNQKVTRCSDSHFVIPNGTRKKSCVELALSLCQSRLQSQRVMCMPRRYFLLPSAWQPSFTVASRYALALVYVVLLVSLNE